MNTYICKNCEQSFEKNFCNNCGQKKNIGRIDLRYFIDEISNSLLQVNQGFFYTLKELFIRPGKSINEFLNGKRQQHFKPLAYLLITSALYVFVAFFLDINTVIEDFVLGYNIGVSDGGKQEDSTVIVIINLLAKNQAYTSLLVLPLFSFASFIAFYKSKYSYLEHLILNTYITGQQMVIYLMLSFLVVEDDFTEAIPFTFGLLFNIWTFYQFFHFKNMVKKISLLFLTYIIFIIQFLIIMIIGIAAV